MNSATILIADKQGREELVRALQGRPSEVQCRLVESMRTQQSEQQPNVIRPPFPSIGRFWLEILLPVLAGASLWFLQSPHF
jgi:hypothetical protein